MKSPVSTETRSSKASKANWTGRLVERGRVHCDEQDELVAALVYTTCVFSQACRMAVFWGHGLRTRACCLWLLVSLCPDHGVLFPLSLQRWSRFQTGRVLWQDSALFFRFWGFFIDLLTFGLCGVGSQSANLETRELRKVGERFVSQYFFQNSGSVQYSGLYFKFSTIPNFLVDFTCNHYL